jgi:hypothetical protein
MTNEQQQKLAIKLAGITRVGCKNVAKIIANYKVKQTDLPASLPSEQPRDTRGRFAMKPISLFYRKQKFDVDPVALNEWLEAVIASNTLIRQSLYDDVGCMETVYAKYEGNLDVPKIPPDLADHVVYKGLLFQAAKLLSGMHHTSDVVLPSALVVSFINVYSRDTDSAPPHRDLVTNNGTVVFVIEQEGATKFQISPDPFQKKQIGLHLLLWPLMQLALSKTSATSICMKAI